MTPREIALSICEPWFNGDPCEGCECHKVCKKLVERIETAIQAERVPEINFGMTRDEIVRLWDKANNWGIPVRSGLAENLERFAALVAAANKPETAIAEAYRCGYESGAKEERTACAALCAEHWKLNGNAMECADAIRNRGKNDTR